MANNLYRGFSEKKWKERIYRAYRYSFSPTDTLWELFRPFLEAADKPDKHRTMDKNLIELVARSIVRALTMKQGHTMEDYIKACESMWPKFASIAEAAIETVNSYKHSEVARSYGKCWQCGYLGFDVEKHACTKTRGDI